VNSIEGSDIENGFLVIGPFGNKFFVHQQKVCDIPRPPFKGNLGINFIELECNKGTAKHIANFYKDNLGAITQKKETINKDVEAFSVSVGPWQQLIFIETDQPPKYDGHHICIYIHDFCITFRKLEKKGLIFVNEKFADRCFTIEQALDACQFRFKDIIEEEHNTIIYCLEHEVRSMYHPSYMRTLVNRNGNIGIFCIIIRIIWTSST